MTAQSLDHGLREQRPPARAAAAGDLTTRTLVVPAQPPAAGALVTGDDVHWQSFRPPSTGALVVAALAVGGATAVGWRWAGRPTAVREITMGPGGWVSFKGTKPPPVSAPRPWWARLLRAERLSS